jgi:predicted NBD/HSP70 family sugar kinase
VAVADIRRRNRALLLGRLRADGPLSRADLARDLGVSAPTVADILTALESEGVVVAVGEGRSSGGRPPVLYGLRMDGLLAVGVNVDATRVTAVVSDLAGGVRAEASAACDLAGGQDAFATTLTGVAQEIVGQVPRLDALAGIGIAVPAAMHHSRKGVFAPVGRRDWRGVDLPALLGRDGSLPVVVENRAHAVAVGEHLFGAGVGATDLLCLTLGPGLGGAVITGGRLVVGGHGGAGALGRMVLDPPGPAAVAKARTVDEVVSVMGIARTAAERTRAADTPADTAEVAGATLDAEQVIDRALAGDATMAEVLADVGRCLGAVVAATLCVTDSGLVLLCGPTMRAGDLVAEPLRETARDLFPFPLPDIRLGRLGVRAGPLGAAALVLRDLVQHDVPATEVGR